MHMCCSETDCDQKILARGLCKRHYNQRRRAGTLPPIPKTSEERFWAKVQRGEPDDCWIWTAATKRGYGHFKYGHFKVDGKMVKAHRFSYALAHGPILDGLHVLHRCDNPPCVNPAHLFPGTNADNIRDKEAKGRGNQPRGTANGKCHLTNEEVAEIRTAPGTQREIGERFGISWPTVSRIKRGKTHRL
jgi:hypothetical protein